MREDLILIPYPFRCHSSYFLTLQAQHSLHCIHGSQVDMPLETFLVQNEGGFRKAYFEE